MNTIVEVRHGAISFKETKALKDVSFSIKEGVIFGFLGPSGAGKTTTIKLLTNQLKPNHGTFLILGKQVDELQDELYQNIGVLSDNSGLYEKLTVYENLKIFADLKKISTSYIDEVLQKTGLYEAKKKKVEHLSKGMKQRLLFSRAILHKPKILFLDEPASALDPASSEAVYEMIFELNRQGTTIFLTTHNMSEADLLCHRVAFLNEGEIKEMGSPDELKLKYAKNEVVILDDKGNKYHTTKDTASLMKTLAAIQGNILRINSVEPDLKTIFLDVTGREL